MFEFVGKASSKHESDSEEGGIKPRQLRERAAEAAMCAGAAVKSA